MLIKMHEILKMHVALQAIAQRPFPAAISLSLSTNAKQIEQLVAANHMAIRKIVDQYAVKEVDGKPKFAPDGTPVWADMKGEAEIASLTDATENLDLVKIPFSAIEKENFPWPVFSSLLPMIDEKA